MTKWEYIKCMDGNDNLEWYGNEGWELVCVSPIDYTWIFKRPQQCEHSFVFWYDNYVCEKCGVDFEKYVKG